jgi:hypothetical protein
LSLNGALPAAECWTMIAEKQLAAMEAMTVAWMVRSRSHRPVSPVRMAAAALGPYRRRTRANARRLSRPAKRHAA